METKEKANQRAKMTHDVYVSEPDQPQPAIFFLFFFLPCLLFVFRWSCLVDLIAMFCLMGFPLMCVYLALRFEKIENENNDIIKNLIKNKRNS